MTDAKYHTPEPGSLEGRIFTPSSPADLDEAVELVFDYRGDVRLVLRTGEEVEGYVYNRVRERAQSYLEMFVNGPSGTRQIRYAEIVSLAFAGKDTASGKSWQAWMAKKDTERKAEAAKAAADAKARGYL